MKRVALLLVMISLGFSLSFEQTTNSAPQNGWPPPNPSCHYIGNSACGGDDHGQCAPHQRFLSQRCDDGRVINACGVDDHCASTNKGRFHIGGSWRGGSYQIAQHGDTFSITGGNAGTASGSFINTNIIFVTWPGAPAFKGTIVNANGVEATKIVWDHPAGNFWVR
jgi:hypothetical protein